MLERRKDLQKAYGWYEKSAKQKLRNAEYRVGLCYFYGWGTKKDPAAAKQWLQRAADQGYTPAKSFLAKHFPG
jgi:uncharacterized protein